MSKNNFYKKMIISVTGATLLSVGLSQVPNNEIGTTPIEASAARNVKVIGANSAVYKQTGKKAVKTKKIIRVGKKVRVYGQKSINGKLYYKIGKNEYIKASNVDAKKRQAAKNTVLYTRSGKVIKNSKVRKGQGVKVYGAVVTINGKKYYSTKYGYIKVSALVKKEKPAKNNNGADNSTQNSTVGNDSSSNSSTGSNSNSSNSNGSTSSGSSINGSDSAGSNGSGSNGSGSTGSNGSSSNGSGSAGSNGSGSNGSDSAGSNGSGSNGSDSAGSNGSGSNGSDSAGSNGSGSNGSDSAGSNGSGSNGSDSAGSNGSGSNGSDNGTTTPTVDPLKDKKAAASTAVRDAANDAINAIKSSPLSDDDQTAAIDRVNKIAQAASDAIDNAKSEKEITDTQAAAIAACQLEPSKIESSDLATKAGEFVTKAGGDETKVKAAVDKAKEAIAKAATKDELDKAEVDLQNDLNEVVPFAKQQEAAVNAIKAAAKAGKDKINNDTTLSDDDKATANATIDAVVEATLGAKGDGTEGDVHDAKTTADLVTALNAVQAVCGQGAVDPIGDPLKDQKAVATTAITNAVSDAVNAIKSSPLSDDDQTAAIDRIKKSADTAIAAIDNAQSEEEIKDIQEKAVAACQLEPSKIESTDLATKAGEFVTKAGGDETKVKAAVDKAKEAIAKAATKDELDKAEVDLQNDLNEVVPFAKQQEAAVNAIKAAAKAGKDKINNDTTLSDDDKATANATIDAVVEATLGAKGDGTEGNVHDAKATADLVTEVNTVLAVCGQENADPITDPLKDQKVAANTAVRDAANDAINAIKSSPLSDADQNAAIDRVNKIAQAASDTIDKAESEKEITDTQAAAIAACQLEPSKIESSDLATKAGEFVTKAGGDETKVKAAVDKAKEAIAKAATKDELDKAEVDLQNDLNEVVPFAKQQEAAVNAIKAAAKAGKDKINNDTTLSDDDKASKNAIIDVVVEAALGAKGDGTEGDVHDAKTTADLVTAVNTVQAACAQVPTDSKTTR
ncbi:DUF1542 domain-containing protein [Lactobacillus apis]|uniref:DUF1542 domain-containing protein n=1 Tax=Lactobacillus apis TaxID=303541 RepID=UPI00242C248E|nr:DUF1542 domain-containing protein [Lactobacillus apis]